MKILFVNDYKEEIGGAEIYMNLTIDELRNQGHEVKLYTSDIKADQFSYRTTHISLKNYINRLFNLKAYKEVKEIVNKFKPDIVHVHGIFNELSPSVIFACRYYPVLMTVHNNQIISPLPVSKSKDGNPCKDEVCRGCFNCVGIKGTLYEIVKRIIHKFLLKDIKLFICPSEYMMNLLIKNGFKNVIRLANGIKPFQSYPITKFDSILFIGRLQKEKGVEYLLNAFPLVLSINPNTKLTLVGTGSSIHYLKSLVDELNITKQVEFLGEISNKNVENFYKNSTIVVVPSIYPDNFPTVCIEAMTAGRPIVGTRVGGIPELIDNKGTGYIVSTNDVNELATSINNLLNNKEDLFRMSKNSLVKSKEYLLSDHLENLIKAYKKVSKKPL